MKRFGPLRYGAAAALVMAAGTGPLAAQGVLRGTVRDTVGRGLPGVDVVLEGTRFQARTDTAGRYVVRAPGGDYATLFRLLGHVPVRETLRITDHDTVTHDITLIAANAQQLATVDVKARQPRGLGLDGFAERKALGLGEYIDSTVLRRSEGRRLGELVREFRGIKVMNGRRGEMYATNPLKSAMTGQPTCFASIYLDRVLVYRAGSRDPPPDLGRDFQIMNLAAIEWYRGSAQVPMEFAGVRNTDCGLLVLWTKRGG
jgi:hypothetical protein